MSVPVECPRNSECPGPGTLSVPGNIVLCRYGEDYDFVKVLDFGIVKAIQEPGHAERAPTVPALTAGDVVRGTPAFIAPEQVLGGLPVDHRADIYATGCLTYWLLTGQLVFTVTRRWSFSFSTRKRRRYRPPHGLN